VGSNPTSSAKLPGRIVPHQTPVVSHQTRVVSHQTRVVPYDSLLVPHQTRVVLHDASVVSYQTRVVPHGASVVPHHSSVVPHHSSTPRRDCHGRAAPEGVVSHHSRVVPHYSSVVPHYRPVVSHHPSTFSRRLRVSCRTRNSGAAPAGLVSIPRVSRAARRGGRAAPRGGRTARWPCCAAAAGIVSIRRSIVPHHSRAVRRFEASVRQEPPLSLTLSPPHAGRGDSAPRSARS
jgi:hypothetical protein